DRGAHAVARFIGALEHALKNLPRTNAQRLILAVDEIAEEKRLIVLPGNLAKGGEIDLCRRIRIAAVPAGVFCVVVANVARISTEYDVAEAEARVDGRQKLFPVDEFAAQDAVDI